MRGFLAPLCAPSSRVVPPFGVPRGVSLTGLYAWRGRFVDTFAELDYARAGNRATATVTVTPEEFVSEYR